MLRKLREPLEGQTIDNAYEITDNKTGQRLGMCLLYTALYPDLFPLRPHLIRIRIEGDPDTYEQLLGTALARSQLLADQKRLPARVFAECPPENERLFDLYMDAGFQNNDGLIRMRSDLYHEADAGLSGNVRDFEDELGDRREQQYFLERYNKLFRNNADEDWMQKYISHDHFHRFMCVNQSGIISEAVVWVEGRVGMLDYVQTANKFRGKGYARHVVNAALDYLRDIGCSECYSVIRAKWPHVIRMMEGAGFTQEELIIRYPGIDIDYM